MSFFLDIEHHIIEFLEGALGDCWLLGAMATFSEKSDLFEVRLRLITTQNILVLFIKNVVPANQSFESGNGYTGAFLFRFWRYGKWIEV